MFSRPKKLIRAIEGDVLGSKVILWQEPDGSMYLSVFGLAEKFYGPLTDLQIAAYESLCSLGLEADDWSPPEPLIDISSLPKKVQALDRKDIAVNGHRYRIHKGDEVILTAYWPPESRHDKHRVFFKLVNDPRAFEYEASVDLFDLKSLTAVVD